MKRVFTTENNLIRVLSQYDHAQARDLNSAKLANDLRFLQREGDPAASQMDYVYNLIEYPSRIKKLFIKGNSKKEVPRQVLNIVTNSFQTRPKVFFSRYDVEFEEFIDPAAPPQAPPAREELAAQVERTAQVEEERDQAIVQVERAEERTARAEVRANRAEADRDRARARPLVVHDEVLEEME